MRPATAPLIWWKDDEVRVRVPKGTVGHGGYDVQLHFISKM